MVIVSFNLGRRRKKGNFHGLGCVGVAAAREATLSGKQK
jgi:hypothetical protein